jgi:hypothetical protein
LRPLRLCVKKCFLSFLALEKSKIAPQSRKETQRKFYLCDPRSAAVALLRHPSLNFIFKNHLTVSRSAAVALLRHPSLNFIFKNHHTVFNLESKQSTSSNKSSQCQYQ